MHQEESFDIVSCRGLEEAQGELFNSAFHETQRSAGSAFIGVSSFNMRIWFLRDKSSTTYDTGGNFSFLTSSRDVLCHFIASYQ